MSKNLNNNFNQDHQNTAGDVNNLYAKKYIQEQMAELEQGAPQLNTSIDRSVNKKAIMFVALTGVGLLGLGAFIFQQLQGSEETPSQGRAQVVTVPDLPPPTVNGVSSSPLINEVNTGQDAKASDVLAASAANPIAVTSNEPPIQIVQPTVPNEPMSNPVVMPDAIENKGEAFIQDGDVTQSSSKNTVATTNAVRYLHNKDKLLLQGTYLRCILETKIISEIPGFTSCTITEPVYSASGKYALIPKGSKVMGQYGSSNPTSGRLGVVWDRIVTPDGIDVTLRSPGVDNLGAAGHKGHFKSHWPSRLGSALLISMISDSFKYAAAEYGPNGETVTTSSSTTTNPYESETADTMKQLAINQLERNNARPNTVTINQGSLINIYTAQDIDFSSAIP